MTNLPEPYNWLLPIGTILVTGLGMMGLTVAKRADLADALRNAGFIRPPDRPAAGEETRADHLRRHQRADRRPDDRRRRLRLPVRHAGRAALRGRRAAAHRRQPRPDPTRPWPARPRGARRRCRRITAVAVELSDEDPPGIDAVDAKLVELARRRGAGILTNDYNLNRVAQLDNVRVLNLNQLANALKPAFLPGDALQVKVIQQGKEPGQGLAYLDDGTMIVVEGGGEMVDTRGRGDRRARPADGRRPDGLRPAAWLEPGRGRSGRFADAVIVAAGSSSRMGGSDKNAELILGRPMLEWSVDGDGRGGVRRARRRRRARRPASRRSRRPWHSTGVTVVAGGEQRSDSVRAGVAADER